MWDRLHGSLRHWHRLLGSASPGARLVEPPGVVASVVPAAAERSVVNAVVYERPEALAGAYDELEAAFAEVGAQWTVWVPDGDRVATRLLGARGHVLDAEPAVMARTLDDPPPRPDLSDWTDRGDLRDLAWINDRAYTHATDSFARALAGLPGDALHVYVARAGGEPAGCLMMADHEGNTSLEMVAVVPEARGRGLAGGLLAHALADAADRGAATSTLIATALGRPVYERLGYRAFGTIQMWERRRPASAAPRSPRT